MLKNLLLQILTISFLNFNCALADKLEVDSKVINEEITSKVAEKSTEKSGEQTSNDILKNVLEKYRSSQYITSEFKKTITSDLMGTTKEFSGVLDFAEGKMNLKISKPQKELVIYDGNTIWVAQKNPPELGGKLIITKSKVSQKSKSQILLTKFFNLKNLEKDYNIKSSDDSGLTKYTFKPKKIDPQLKKVELLVEAKELIIFEFKYWDEVENEISYKFTNHQFHKNPPTKNLFNFKIPPGAEVTEI